MKEASTKVCFLDGSHSQTWTVDPLINSQMLQPLFFPLSTDE
jgi:hypothetical protein